jgi:hypothetical protein
MQVICQKCGKGFKDDLFLKAHMDSKHKENTNLEPEFKGLILDVSSKPIKGNCDTCGQPNHDENWL